MKTISTIILIFLATLSFAKPDELVKAQANRALANAPLHFTRNDGQIDTHGKADCRFYTSLGGGNYFFCADGVVSDYQKRSEAEQENVARLVKSQHDLTSRATIRGHALKLNFVGRTNFAAEVTGEDEQEYKCNYFIGNVQEKWHTNVPNYSRIRYRNVWEGIDVEYYGADVARLVKSQQSSGDLTSRATLEYDLIVAPGANPNKIQFAYEGDEGISINAAGALVTKTSLGDVIEQKPYVYQIIDGEKKEIESNFILPTTGNHAIAFALGEYDKTKELIIDPVYSTFLGGTGAEYLESIAVDAGGNVYVCGNSSVGTFPTTQGAYQRTRGTDTYNGIVTKINPSGSSLVYSTFFGGNSRGASNDPQSIAVDASGNAYITGSTSSPSFPTTPGAYQTTFKSLQYYSVFLTKFNANGSALVFSTYLGGSVNDYSLAVAVDTAGSAFVTGRTESPDFPTTSGAYQIAPKGSSNVFVTKFNPSGTQLLYSTFLSGSASPPGTQLPAASGRDIALDRNNNAYITGCTNYNDFPTTPGAYQTSVKYINKNNLSVFVTKINSSGSGLVYSTFLSGSSTDGGEGIAVDAGGNAYITGETSSPDFPITPGAYQSKNVTNGFSTDVFVTKLNASGSALVYSTFIGGLNGYEYSYSVSLDAGGYAYITGNTDVPDFPTTQDAYQSKLKGGGSDAFVTKVNPSGSALVYSTFLGDSLGDRGTCIAVDAVHNVYVSGVTNSINFPTTPDAYQTTFGGAVDGFVAGFSLVPVIGVADTVNFGYRVCETSVDTIITIRDSAIDIGLWIDSVRIVGPNASDFKVVSPDPNIPLTYPYFIQKDSSAPFTIRFIPTGTGVRTAYLKIYSNDDLPQSDTLKTVILIGYKDSTAITASKTSIDFGVMQCADSLRDSTVDIKNTGTVPITVTPTFFGAGLGSYSATPTSATIAAGRDTTFTIRFHPSGVGTFPALCIFNGSLCDRADTVTLTGSKLSTASILGLPSSLDYSMLTCGQEKDSNITVTNTSAVNVTLDSAKVSGASFTLLSPKGTVTLAPGASQQYTVHFAPGASGNYNGTFSVTGEPCHVSTSHPLSGVKDSITISSSLENVDFGKLRCNVSQRDTVIVIRNNSIYNTVSVTVNSSSMAGTGYSIVSPFGTRTLAKNTGGTTAGDTMQVRIHFAPTSTGIFSGTLTLTGTPCNAGVTVAFTGRKDSLSVASSPSTLDFAPIVCGGTKDSVITIKNTGTDTVTIDPATITGSGFTLISPTGSVKLAPSDSVKYTVRFTPGSASGNYSGNFTIAGTPCVSSSLTLSGKKDSVAIMNTPRSVNYGTITSCSALRDTIVSVANTGTTSVTVDTSFTGNNGALTIISPTVPFTIANGSSQDVHLRLKAGSLPKGSFNSLLTFTGTPCDVLSQVNFSAEKTFPALTVSVPNVTVNVGRHVLVPVVISDSLNGDVSSYTITCSYDRTMLHPHGIVTQSTMSEGTTPSLTIPAPGTFSVTASNPNGFHGKGVLFLIDMEGLISSNVTTSAIGFEMSSFTTMPCNEITTTDGEVSLTGCESNRFVANATTLSQNQPNPFSQLTVVSYQLSGDAEVELAVYDVFGRKVKMLDAGYRMKGSHDVSINTIDLSPGVYVYQLRSAGIIIEKKMVVMK